jgi:hypothetical protein
MAHYHHDDRDRHHRQHGHHSNVAALGSSHSLHSSPNVVGVHYRVGRKIGEGSFGVLYEGE